MRMGLVRLGSEPVGRFPDAFIRHVEIEIFAGDNIPYRSTRIIRIIRAIVPGGFPHESHVGYMLSVF